MSSLGQTLRQAREAKGLTQSQVASQTRILVQIIDDIENEDFHRIAAPIYGRGFVRLYAECVDLDSQPLIREFMDIYEGRRAPTVLVRDVPTAPPIPPAPTAEPVMDVQVPEAHEPEVPQPEPPPPVPEVPPEPAAVPIQPILPETEIPPQQTPFAPLPTVPPSPVEPEPLWDPPTTESTLIEPPPVEPPPVEPPPVEPPPVEPPPPVVRGLDLFDQAAGIPRDPTPTFTEQAPQGVPPPSPVSEATESPFLPPLYEDNGPSAADRFKSGISSVSHGVLSSVRKIPRSAWRKTMLALVVVSVLAVLVFGCVKLYQMTTSTPPDSCPDGTCEYNPKAQTSPTSQTAKPAPAKEATKVQASTQQKSSTNKTAPKTAPAPKAPGKIHSTGQKVAPLYVD